MPLNDFWVYRQRRKILVFILYQIVWSNLVALVGQVFINHSALTLFDYLAYLAYMPGTALACLVPVFALVSAALVGKSRKVLVINTVTSCLLQSLGIPSIIMGGEFFDGILGGNFIGAMPLVIVTFFASLLPYFFDRPTEG